VRCGSSGDGAETLVHDGDCGKGVELSLVGSRVEHSDSGLGMRECVHEEASYVNGNGVVVEEREGSTHDVTKDVLSCGVVLERLSPESIVKYVSMRVRARRSTPPGNRLLPLVVRLVTRVPSSKRKRARQSARTCPSCRTGKRPLESRDNRDDGFPIPVRRCSRTSSTVGLSPRTTASPSRLKRTFST